MPQLLHEEQRQWCFLYLPHRLFRAPQKNMASRWVVKAGLLCPSEWFQTEAHQQEGEMMVLQVAPAGALGLKSLPTLEQVSAWRPSGPFVGISLQKHPKARHSFPLVNSGNALRQPHSTLLSRAGLCGEALCVQTVSRQGSGAAATWRGPEAGPSSQCPQPSALYMSWHWPQTGFCQKLPEKVAFHSSRLKGTRDDKYFPHLITETVSKPMEKD